MQKAELVYPWSCVGAISVLDVARPPRAIPPTTPMARPASSPLSARVETSDPADECPGDTHIALIGPFGRPRTHND